ncbi:hypothetical protein N431DRAFT_518082 [Stipitochalara longipes BDJ]|nr:hypothetical protein N431DRAFT_518082 [Stipitochalara longipes BDJ]
MLYPLAMFERAKETASFSEIPIKEESLLARLKPNKAHVLPTRWPNPQESVGKRCCNIGEQIFWEVKDPARTKLASLEVEVQKLLNDHNEHLKEREACNLSFSLFMVGRHETTSCPTLVIISTNKKSRQKVVSTIRTNGILAKYEGVLLGTSSRHPRYPDAGPAQYIALHTEERSPQPFPHGIVVYMRKSLIDLTSGMEIYIPVTQSSEWFSGGLLLCRKATLGGFLELKKQNGEKTTVGMTVAHAFEDMGGEDEPYIPDQSEASEEDTADFEFDGPNPDDFPENEFEGPPLEDISVDNKNPSYAFNL